MDKLDYLIEYLLKESKDINIEKLPKDLNDKKRLYRSLCNIREPIPVSNEYIKIENEYLKEESRLKGIVDSRNITAFANYTGTQICLWKGDITTLKIEAIVNAANSQGLGCFIPCHKCIDNAIHSASGIELRLECNKIMQKLKILQTGKAFITSGYNLPSKYIIHTVGPIIYENVTDKNVAELEECYINALELARENNIKEIAFPCISTGEFRFPKDLASEIAIKAIRKYIDENKHSFEKIIFNVFTEEDYNIYFKKLGDEYGRV